MPNRLADETSPYLLQHAHNPVDWYPWGEAAFAEARRRDVPVFLSVGYSTCYWCHVMERQVFENEALARQMNEGFVSIKVDREERPDVDEHYMTATQLLSGQGGWPMSVFMSPEGQAFLGGTYFPPEDQYGRPGFGRIMDAITEAWRERRDQVLRSAEHLREILQRLGQPAPPRVDVAFDDETLISLIERSSADYDRRLGGFGGAPKFPRQTLLEMLLVASRVYGHRLDHLDAPLRHTLDAMANGGIRDHLGGGFHRYSTDAKWLVPHFEIMLYDQAMLAWVYIEACRQMKHDRYGRVARGVLDFVLREMTSESGAFYTAFDAEVDAQEGANYLWTPAEVEAVLGAVDAAVFSETYGLDQGFNFADPHGPNPDSPDRNVLFLAKPERENDPKVRSMRKALLEARRKRKGPMLDTKVLTSWNALMIRALAYAGATLDVAKYTTAAERAAEWLLANHRTSGGGLARSSREGKVAPIDGFLDDYALLGRACVALAQATGNAVWRDRAGELADQIERRFGDAAAGGFWFSDTSADELGAMTGVRRKVGADSPLPSGNGAAALLMLELNSSDAARRVIEAFAGQIAEQTGNVSTLLEAAVVYANRAGTLRIAGQRPEGPEGLEQEAQDAVDVINGNWASSRRLEVVVRIAEGYHLYGRDSEQAPAVHVGSPHEAFERAEVPPGVNDEQLAGEQTFVLHFKRSVSQEAVEVVMRYQACDETRCLPPVTKHMEIRPKRPAPPKPTTPFRSR